MGYEEAAKLFRRIDDEKSSEYNKFAGMIKKFVVETNAMAQEKAVEAALAFVECAAIADRWLSYYYETHHETHTHNTAHTHRHSVCVIKSIVYCCGVPP